MHRGLGECGGGFAPSAVCAMPRGTLAMSVWCTHRQIANYQLSTANLWGWWLGQRTIVRELPTKIDTNHVIPSRLKWDVLQYVCCGQKIVDFGFCACFLLVGGFGGLVVVVVVGLESGVWFLSRVGLVWGCWFEVMPSCLIWTAVSVLQYSHMDRYRVYNNNIAPEEQQRILGFSDFQLLVFLYYNF